MSPVFVTVVILSLYPGVSNLLVITHRDGTHCADCTLLTTNYTLFVKERTDEAFSVVGLMEGLGVSVRSHM